MSNSVEVMSRRQFLIRLGGASATITVAGAGLSSFLNMRNAPAPAPEALKVAQQEATPEPIDPNAVTLPNADDPMIPAPGTRPEYTPVEDHYRIDIAAVPPTIKEEDWKLPIGGLVENPLELTLQEIKDNYTPLEQFITMSCISNRVGGDLISTTLWTGASFRDILADAKPLPNATHIKISSADGFDEALPLEVALNDPTVTLNYYFDRKPLAVRNGFPLRIHIPNHFGMKQPKWITNVELIEGDHDGYWVRRGWSKDAIIRATSVIDTVAVDSPTRINAQQYIPIGGIAWAGPRRVSKVEISIDGGDWEEAQLRAPLNNTPDTYKTWIIWRYDWLFSEGSHVFTVRMIEADGAPQIERIADTYPDGATGLHTFRV